MVIAYLPIGGAGTRIGAPFPKELLPVPRCERYESLVGRAVRQAVEAGARKIVLGTGEHPKPAVREHVERLPCLRPAGARPIVLDEAASPYGPYGGLYVIGHDEPALLLLPDVVYHDDILGEFVHHAEAHSGGLDVVVGIARVDDNALVDRLSEDKTRFVPKISWGSGVGQRAWEALYFTEQGLRRFHDRFPALQLMTDILNESTWGMWDIGWACDVGTWSAYWKLAQSTGIQR